MRSERLLTLRRQFYHIKFAGVKQIFVNFSYRCKNATVAQVSVRSQTMHHLGALCPNLVQLVSTRQPPGLAAPVQNLDEPTYVAPVQILAPVQNCVSDPKPPQNGYVAPVQKLHKMFTQRQCKNLRKLLHVSHCAYYATA